MQMLNIMNCKPELFESIFPNAQLAKKTNSPLITKSNRKQSLKTRALVSHKKLSRELSVKSDTARSMTKATSEELESYAIEFARQRLRKASSEHISTILKQVKPKFVDDEYISIPSLENDITKTTENFHSIDDPDTNEIIVSVKSSKGARAKNEDRYIYITNISELFGLKGPPVSYFAVFDGHAGSLAAEYAKVQLHANIIKQQNLYDNVKEAIREGYRITDDRFIKHAQKEDFQSGTTAVTALIIGPPHHRKLYIANVGDSLGILCRKGEVINLSFPHKPDKPEEKKRLEKKGAIVTYFDGVARVNGVMGISRSIGDLRLKKYLTCEPYITEIDLTPDDEFLVLATDGVWDVISKKDMMLYIRDAMNEFPTEKAYISDVILQRCKKLNAKDNMTCMVIFLK
jgi:serine/threonine protein phosphatase PrpC